MARPRSLPPGIRPRGLRLGELLALSRERGRPRRVIHVRATLSEVARRKPRLMIEEPKSEAGVRDVPIVEPLAELLVAHLDRLPAGQQHRFMTQAGRFLDRTVYKVWCPLRTSLGLPNLRFHDLRHTAASLLLTYSDAKASELTEILGHSQIAHTVDSTAT